MTQKSEIILEQMALGPMENFIYFLGDAKVKEVAIIDPAWDISFLREKAQKNKWNITVALLTHGHPDHLNGVDELLSTHDIPVYISQHEAPFYTPKCKNLKKVKPNQKLQIGNLEIECLHTPGHSPGCQCFLTGGHLISGDTIFIDGCGRCDLPGSDVKAMYNSLYNIIMKLPEATRIYPGHNYGPTPYATLEEQKKTNPYLRCRSLEEFLVERMGMVF
jgi:glyoxylase-like metal-dependent hydrolase (beta-lactamase superfamily II)